MEDEELTKKVIGFAFKVHNSLGSGFLEKVYENALRIELSRAGLRVEQQIPIQVYYQGGELRITSSKVPIDENANE
jgi:GxxExxY protein